MVAYSIMPSTGFREDDFVNSESAPLMPSSSIDDAKYLCNRRNPCSCGELVERKDGGEICVVIFGGTSPNPSQHCVNPNTFSGLAGTV